MRRLYSGKNSGPLEVNGCCVSSGVFSSSSSQSRRKIGEFWNRQTFTVSHWTNCRWYIWVLHWPFFHPRNPFLKRWHHTEVAVCEVICQLPPHQGDCKRHGTFLAICVQLWRIARAAHVRSPAACPGRLLYNQNTGSRFILSLALKQVTLKQTWFLHIHNRSYPHCSHSYGASLSRLKQRLT